ncbi:hypothetical protein EBB07_23075 [Paenibacillaceae bacterium]|nr:hypothetical protein EBB07_23075 [Paenibacillaceae bacterium]
MILAAIDIIMCPNDWLRVHHFHSGDGVSELGTIDNGAGDLMYVVFANEGVIIKGFDHESPFSPHARDEYEVWPGIYEGAPQALLNELAQLENLEYEEVTFCLWQAAGDNQWRSGTGEHPNEMDDGADFLLGYLYETPEDYAEWARSYFEQDIDMEAVREIYSGAAITAALIHRLAPERETAEAIEELIELGVKTQAEDE